MRVDVSYGEAGEDIDEPLSRSSTCLATGDEDCEGFPKSHSRLRTHSRCRLSGDRLQQRTVERASREAKLESRGMLWRVARGLWSPEDRDEDQLVEDRRWCQYRGLAAMQKKHSAARAWSTEQRPDRRRQRGEADREAVSHGR